MFDSVLQAVFIRGIIFSCRRLRLSNKNRTLCAVGKFKEGCFMNAGAHSALMHTGVVSISCYLFGTSMVLCTIADLLLPHF